MANPINDKYLKRLAEIESSNNPNAKAKTSSAAGLYQFTESTWKDLVDRMGVNYTLEDRFDPNKSKEVVKKFTKDNKDYLESRLKRGVSDSELYLAHFLGRSGALNLLTKIDANENPNVNDLFSEKAVQANQSIFLNEDGSGKTGYDILNWANDKFGIENTKVSVDPNTLNSPEAVKQNEVTGFEPEDLPTYQKQNYETELQAFLDPVRALQNRPEFKFENGGTLDTKTINDPNQVKLTEYNKGGTHEENIHGGIHIGDNNLVEEGETRYEDYIFSNELKVTEDDIKRYAFPKRFLNKTYSEASKDITKELEDNPYNKILNSSAQRVLDQLTLANENNKNKTDDMSKKYNKGGSLGPGDKKKKKEQPQDTLSLSPFYNLYKNANMPNASFEDQTKFSIAKREMADYFNNVNGNNPRDESMEQHIKRMKLREAAANKQKLNVGGEVLSNTQTNPLAGNVAGGIGQGMSLLSQFMPEDSDAKNPLSLAGQGASLGMMAGPIGAGVGAVVGAGAGLLMNKKQKEKQIEQSNNSALSKSAQFDNTFKKGGQLDPPYKGWKSWHKPQNHWRKYKNGQLMFSGEPYSIRNGEVFLTKDLPDIKDSSQTEVPESLRQNNEMPVNFPQTRNEDFLTNYTNPGIQNNTGDTETGKIKSLLPLMGDGQNINIEDPNNTNKSIDFTPGLSNVDTISRELSPIGSGGSYRTADNQLGDAVDSSSLISTGQLGNLFNSNNSSTSNAVQANSEDKEKFNPASLLRYAPTVGNIARLLSSPDAEIERLNRLDNRYQRDLVDENTLQRNAREAGNNTRRALRDASAGSASNYRSSLLGSQLNESRALSEAMFQGDQINRQENQAAQQFNSNIDRINLSQDNQEKQINAQNRAAAQSNKDVLLNSILGDLGNIGKESNLNEILKKVTGYNYQGKKINNLGGMLSQMKHYNGEDIKELVRKKYGY